MEEKDERRRLPEGLRQPTKKEKEMRERVHMPYAAWCEVCLKARGKNSPHKEVQLACKPEEVQVDYSFTRHGNEQIATMLIATHVQSL